MDGDAGAGLKRGSSLVGIWLTTMELGGELVDRFAAIFAAFKSRFAGAVCGSSAVLVFSKSSNIDVMIPLAWDGAGAGVSKLIVAALFSVGLVGELGGLSGGLASGLRSLLAST